MRSEGEVSHVEQEAVAVLCELSSLGKGIAQVQSSSCRTSTALTASNNARGESLPLVLSTEVYETETDCKEEKKTEISYLWCHVCFLFTIHVDSCICFDVLFQKKVLLDLL